MEQPTNPFRKPLRMVEYHKRVQESVYDGSWILSEPIQVVKFIWVYTNELLELGRAL